MSSEESYSLCSVSSHVHLYCLQREVVTRDKKIREDSKPLLDKDEIEVLHGLLCFCYDEIEVLHGLSSVSVTAPLKLMGRERIMSLSLSRRKRAVVRPFVKISAS